MAVKVIFRKSDGRILGAQAVGEDGVDKRIDALAMAIKMDATVFVLEEVELSNAPQFGSAKSPINFVGMVAANALRGDMPLTHWNSGESGFLLDVRHPTELAVEQVPGAVNIPLDELPRDHQIHVICRSGLCAYYATRILLHPVAVENEDWRVSGTYAHERSISVLPVGSNLRPTMGQKS